MQNILNIDKLKFDDNGLIPAIIIDYYTKEVLTLAYMNKESLEISLKEGKTCFYSRINIFRVLRAIAIMTL